VATDTVAISLKCIVECRLNGSYESLRAGKIQDALVDFTGGVGEVMTIQDRPADQLFQLMMDIEKMNTLMGASISVSDNSSDTVIRVESSRVEDVDLNARSPALKCVAQLNINFMTLEHHGGVNESRP